MGPSKEIGSMSCGLSRNIDRSSCGFHHQSGRGKQCFRLSDQNQSRAKLGMFEPSEDW